MNQVGITPFSLFNQLLFVFSHFQTLLLHLMDSSILLTATYTTKMLTCDYTPQTVQFIVEINKTQLYTSKCYLVK